jgi:vacuolar-type H+-ATPase subunit I/STV1
MTFLEFVKKQAHNSLNFIIGATLLLSVLLLPEATFGRWLQIILGILSVIMVGLKTWKFIKQGILHFTFEDAYIFLSAVVILTLVVWLPDYIFGLSVKIAFGIAGLVLIVIAVINFLAHIKEYRKSQG